MTRNATARKIARRPSLLAAVACLALMLAPTAGMASAPAKFGAKLNSTVQPSNSLPGLTRRSSSAATSPRRATLTAAGC